MSSDQVPTAHQIVADYLRRMDGGATLTEQDVIAKYPQLEKELQSEFRELNLITEVVEYVGEGTTTQVLTDDPSASDTIDQSLRNTEATTVRCPHCNKPTRAHLEGAIRAVECDGCGKQFSLIRDRDWPNRIEQYELLERIGIGGFGSVWKAQDHKLDRLVAIKLPRRSFLEEEDAQQFLREARTAANLNHPNIVKFYDVGFCEGSIFIASELIDGEPLSRHIGNGLTEKEAIQLAQPIARALAYAHEQGVIHRDLKPSNVILGSNGNPYLSDFGLARRGESDLTVTVSGQILGTPSYMPPEQARGDSHNADARSDIYSFGILLYELLTGQVPFTGAPETVLVRVQTEEPVHPRKLNHSISRDVDTICMKCLEKDPEKRYQSAEAVAEELERLATGEPILARPIGIAGQTVRWTKRNPVIAMLTACLTAAFIAASLQGSYLIAQGRLIEQQNAISVGQTRLSERRAEISETRKRQSLIAQVREIRAAAQAGYRNRVFEILRDNPDLIRDERFRKDLRDEAILCMGDFAAYGVREFDVPDEGLSSAAISPDGSLVAIGFDSGRIEVHDAQQLGQLLYQADVDDEPVAIQFRGEPAHQLLSIGSRGAIHELSLGKKVTVHRIAQVREFPSREDLELGGLIRSAQFSANGRFVAFTDGAAAIVWNIDEAKEVFDERPAHPLIQEASAIRSVVVSPDGRWVTAGYSDELAVGGVIRWELSSENAEHETLTGQQSERSVAISDDGKWVAVGCEQTVLFETETLQRRLFFQDTEVKALAFRPRSSYLAVVYNSGIVEIKNHRTNGLVAQFQQPKNHPHTGVSFSQNGSRLLAWNQAGIRILGMDSHTERLQIDGHVRAVPALHFTPDGQQLVSCSKDGSVRFWDPNNGQPISHIPDLGQIQCAVTHPTEPWVAIAQWARPNSLTIWESSGTVWRHVHTVQNDLGMICGLGFTADGKYLAASGDNGLQTWSIQNLNGEPKTIRHWPQENARTDVDGPVHKELKQNRKDKFLVFDNSGQRLFHANAWGYDVKYLDLRTDPPASGHLGSPTGRDMLIGWHGLAFTPNNELVFVTPDNGVDVWDVDDMSTGGQRIRSIARGSFSDPNVAINRQGMLAIKAGPKTVTIWDLDTDQEVFTFRKERSTIYSLAWNPEGTKLAVGLADGGISIWDLSKIRKELHSLGFAL